VERGVREGRESVLILPGFADVRRARERFASTVAVGIDITTFEQWLESLWRQQGDGRQLVSTVLRRNLVAQACPAGESMLGRASQSPGTVELVARMAARSAGLVRGRGAGRAGESVERILQAYEQLLFDHGLIEPGEAVKQLSASEAVAGFTIAWDRFTDLSAAQIAFIGKLAQRNEVVVALTWEEGFAACEALTPIAEQLAEIASLHMRMHRPSAPSDELELLEATLYAPQSAIAPGGSVVLSEASGAEAEAVLVAAAAARAIGDGVEPGQVAVVFRDLSRHRDLVEAALWAEGVPFSVEFQSEFSATPLGSALLSLAGAVSGSRGREELLHLLRGPFSDVPAQAVDELDSRWRRTRVDDPGRLLSHASKLSPMTGRVIQLAEDVLRRTVTEETVEKWQEMVSTMLSVASEERRRHEADVRIDAAVHGRIMETVALMAASGVAVSGINLLMSLAQSMVSTGSAERPGTVQVTDAHRIRSRSFDAVVLGGLTADEFSSEKPEPLAATLLGGMGLSAGMDERLAERMLFYLVVTRARKRLELVRQSSDASGGARRPSVFWEEIRDLYRTPAQAAMGEDGQLEVSYRMTLGELEHAAPALTLNRREARELAAEGRLDAPGLSRGRVSQANETWPSADEFSVTELETYLDCPYRWFYSRVLRPVDVDRRFDARSRGSYAHAMLAGFYQIFTERGHSRVTAENLPDALNLLEEVVTALQLDPEWQTRGLKEELSASAARSWVKAAIEQDVDMLEGFETAAHEWAFGGDSGLAFEIAGVALRGKVDRIDQGPEGIVVTDYKSASVVHGQAGFAGHRIIQCVVYARAASTGFAAPAVAGVYRSLPTGVIRGFWNVDLASADPTVHSKDEVSAERFGELLTEVEMQISNAVEGIRARRIEPAPANRRSCALCEASSFCRRAYQ
jgi:hypothetical protein